MELSIIIPTLDEDKNIRFLIPYLKSQLLEYQYEIIVADAGSSDKTRSIADSLGVKVLNCKKMSRSFQMNEGAKLAKGSVLYFLHADVKPPTHFFESIKAALSQGYELGCFRFKFDSNKPLLAINSYFTRFKSLAFRGGDQSLFITKQAFEKLDGFSKEIRIMEEYDFILRAKQNYRFKIIPKEVIVSARKYKVNSYLRVNFANFVVFSLFRCGASQKRMLAVYRFLIKHPKEKSLK